MIDIHAYWRAVLEQDADAIDEYWGDDGPAPDWRRGMNLGRPIREVEP